MNSINFPRRYYLLQRIRARADESPTEPAWQAKQKEQPGTPLPAAFPYRARLFAVGYETYADFIGADENELRVNVGLTPRECELVFGQIDDDGWPDGIPTPGIS